MRLWNFLFVVIAAVACSTSALLGESVTYKNKKLIEYGWDAVSADYVRRNVRKIEKLQFDGVVIRILAEPEKGAKSDVLSRRAFNRDKFPPGPLDNAIQDLKATKFQRFTDNFIQMVASPVIDWFDPEWENCAYNASCLARVAKQSGAKGLMFDPEDYADSELWCYKKIAEGNPAAHSWEDYVAQVRLCGSKMMKAINKEYPGITLLCLVGPTFAYSGPDIKANKYGLLAAFYDGMCQTADQKTTIVDGFEQSYGWKEDREKFAWARTQLFKDAQTASANSKEFAEHMRVGFGVWADYRSHIIGWHPEDFSKNFYSPDSLRTTLAYALEASDRYVWIYSQLLRWWDHDVPKEYVDALKQAKEGRVRPTSSNK